MMLALAETMLASQAHQQQTQTTRIQRHQVQRQHEIELEKEARDRECQATQSKGGFFHDLVQAVKDVASDVVHARFADALSDLNDDIVKDPQFWKDLESGAGEIAKWAAVAGSVALAVASGGAGAPVMALAITGAVLSVAAATDSEAHVLEKCGVDAKTAGWIDVGMSVGGAVCGAGAGLLAASSSAGVAANAGSATGASSLQRGVQTAGTIVDCGAAGAGAVRGAAHVEVGKFEADGLNAAADVKGAELAQQRIDRLVKLVLDAMSDAYQSGQKSVGDVQNALTTYGRAMTTAATMRA
jgi:hypothetical protein